MSATRYEVAVIGLGALGSCALAELSRRGRHVVGLDRFAPPHDRGSSHGGSRVIRLSYYEHPDYVPLLRRAYEGFDRLARDTGAWLRAENGLVMGGAPGNPVTAGMLRSAAAHGLTVDAIDGSELMRRFPQFSVPFDWEVVYEARGGFVRPEATIAAALRLASSLGARVETNAPVQAWGADAHGAWVESRLGRIEADALVVAGGAWMPGLLGVEAPVLRPTRETIVWIDDAGDPSWNTARMPVWLFDRGAAPSVYGIPAFDGMGSPHGMKIGLHGRGPDAPPSAIDQAPEAGIVDETVDAAAERLAAARGRAVVAAKHCLYTMSADGDFLLGLHPAHRNGARVAIACGCSGHAFKFAPVIGEALADLALNGCSELPIGFLDPARRGGLAAHR